MIAYIEKGYGLHAAIAAAGLRLTEVDGVWQADDEAAVQAIIEAYADPLPDLNRAQFAFLLALSGFELVWDGLEAAMQAADPLSYATLKGMRASESFAFERVMAMIGAYRDWLPKEPTLTRDEVADVWRFTLANF